MSEARAIHEAYKKGDLEGLRALLGDPPDFPNCRGPEAMGEIILEYAIYHSPLPFIRTLLAHGANASARTQVDDFTTPLEEAEILGRAGLVRSGLAATAYGVATWRPCGSKSQTQPPARNGNCQGKRARPDEPQ